MGMPYTHDYEVRYNDSGGNARVTPVALYSYLQETALRHCDHIGLTTQKLFEMGYTWMLNRVHLRIHHYPRYKETIKVETWPVNIGGLYSLREFNVRDESGACCALATTRWVLIEVAKRRPARPPESMAAGFELCARRAFEDDFPRLGLVEHPIAAKTFHVRLSDLDINRHANSRCYFDWALEAVPNEVLRGYVPSSIEIHYRREVGLGGAIEASSSEIPGAGEGMRGFLHALAAKDNAGLLAQGRSYWRMET